MSIKVTPIVYTEDRATNQNNINTSNAFGGLAKNPQLNGNTLTGTVLVSGNNQIPHKLSRKFSGWSLINKYGPGDVYSYTPTTNYQPELFLYLTSTVNMTVDLSVF